MGTVFLTFIFLSLQTAARPAVPLPLPSAQLTEVAGLEAAELRFFYEWGDAYRLSQGRRSATAYDQSLLTPREMYLHCHFKTGRDAGVPTTRVVNRAGSEYSTCPSWNLETTPLPYDETRDLDAALVSSLRPLIRNARESVIALFDAAAARSPANGWIAGQRVRLLIDQREFERARQAAAQCASSQVWCAQLAGMALAAGGNVVAADSAFAAALSGMTADARCKAADISILLEPDERTRYQRTPCAQRDSLEARIWWLSDPLYIEPGNARRVEHFARQTLVQVRQMLSRDERWDWNSAAGGDVLGDMIMRYGWPSYAYWGGTIHDDQHSGYLIANRSPLNAPYTTFEYAAGRLQTIPLWRAIEDPTHARASDWAIGDPDVVAAPKAAPKVVEVIPPERTLEAATAHVSKWWPQQHFAPVAPIVQLPEGQVALFRRQADVMIATATELSADALGRPRGDSVAAVLMTTSSADSIRVLTRAMGIVGSPLVIQSTLAPRATLAAIEFPPDANRARAGGRTRFGVTPPATLVTMKPGDVAMSDLAILIAPANGSDLPVATRDVLARMAPSSVLAAGSRFGVYWESYGIAQNDSVDFAVWIERVTPQGILRKFGIALSVATDLNTPVAISWSESSPNPRTAFIGGPVPVIGRSVVLDASKLRPGDYWIDVVIRRAGSEPVRSRRPFTVRNP